MTRPRAAGHRQCCSCPSPRLGIAFCSLYSHPSWYVWGFARFVLERETCRRQTPRGLVRAEGTPDVCDPYRGDVTQSAQTRAQGTFLPRPARRAPSCGAGPRRGLCARGHAARAAPPRPAHSGTPRGARSHAHARRRLAAHAASQGHPHGLASVQEPSIILLVQHT